MSLQERSYSLHTKLETLGDLVKIGNDSYTHVVGIGDICVGANTGYTMILKDVRHVLDICLNLISTYVLDKEGYGNCLSDGKWRLSKG